MIISTSSHNILLFNELDDFVVDTMTKTLERLADGVLSVDVFLKDVNGPKGGVDKQVIVRAHLRNRQQLAVETIDENLYAAIKSGAKRMKRAVRRSLEKSRRIEKLSVARRQGAHELVSGPSP